MPGYILHLGATVLCAHGGQAQPTVVQPRLRVAGQPVTTQPAPYVIAGCALTPSGGPFCVTAQFVAGATRVRSNGLPLLLQDSPSVATATGTPLAVVSTQIRVRAS